MKKIFFVLIAAFLALGLVSPALAKPGNKVAKGEVTSINADGTITIQTLREETIVVVPPAGYDLSALSIGDILLVKGRFDSAGRLAAEWLKIPDDGWGDDEDEKDEDKKPGNSGQGKGKDKDKDKNKSDDDDEQAFCEEGAAHPVAVRLAERYGVSTDWVMGYFCSGYGMGQIMLALKTAEISGADADALLAERAEGKGWGKIWQEMKLIGKDRDAQSPPGWLKKK